MRRFLGSMSLLLCSACVHGGSSTPVAPTDALSIEYNLPVTSVRLSMDLVLTDCANGRLLARPTVALQPASNPNQSDAERFRLHSTNLSSWTRNKQVTVELHPNGALKTVNGAVSDRTGAIVTNVLKTVLSVVPFMDPAGAKASVCNDETMQALRQVDRLQARLDGLRLDLPAAPPARAAEIRLAIDAVAAEIARLRTEQLLISFNKDLEIPRREPFQQTLTWTGKELARWLKENDAGTGTIENFKLTYCIARVTAINPAKCPELPLRESTITAQPEPADCLPGCPETIVLREPILAALTVLAGSNDFVRLLPSGKRLPIPLQAPLQKASVQVAQWGKLSYVPLRAGFGESNTFAVGLDEFGRRSSFTWKSDARAEGITGSVASIADAGAKLEAALRNQNLAEQQAEITELQTLQNLNRLRFCREILEAGGFNCPTS